MSSPYGPLRLIVNPRSGRGSVRRCLPEFLGALEGQDLDYDVVETSRRGHAIEAARTALAEGIRFLVAVGGDGTVHEVVNGMVTRDGPVAEDAVLGVFAAGSGCDFIRTFGMDRKAEVVAKHFATDQVLPIDVGHIRYTDADGNPAERLFANIAEVGYGAEAVRLAERFPRWIGRLRYLFAAWGAIRRVNQQDAVVHLGQTEVPADVVNLVVANCQFFGGGMKVAPRALPDDGRFTVQVFGGRRSDVFMLTPKIYRGEHMPHPNISEYHGPSVRFAPPEPMRLEADGEVLGVTPAEFTIVPRALRLKI